MNKSTAKEMADEAPEGWLCGMLFALSFPDAADRIRRALKLSDRRELQAKANELRTGMR